MIRSRFYVDGVDLNVPDRRVVMAGVRLHGPENVEIANVRVPGRDGIVALPETRTVGAGSWELDVTVMGPTYAAMLEAKAELEALLSPTRRSVVVREDVLTGQTLPGTVAHQLEAEAILVGAEMVSPWGKKNHSARMRYKFQVPSGIWREPWTQHVVTGAGTYSIPSLVGGSAPQYSLRLTAVPSGSTLTVRVQHPTDTDAWLSFVGTGLTPGVPVEIFETYYARQGSKNVTRFLDRGPAPMRMDPDGKVTVVSLAGAPSLTIQNRKGWY